MNYDETKLLIRRLLVKTKELQRNVLHVLGL
jgi:hypothetical protein